jgi:hypothetical protein
MKGKLKSNVFIKLSPSERANLIVVMNQGMHATPRNFGVYDDCRGAYWDLYELMVGGRA